MSYGVERLLRKIQRKGTESESMDAKEYLHLDKDGDKANFTRHVAALANTGIKSYLLLGVENKTWKIKGIEESSLLLDADATQQRMNQILENKVDPPISVSYTVHEIGKATVGLVEIGGKTPPYIISLTDSKYGGPKTNGSRSYIYNGVIYRRQGANSVPANRQGAVLQVLNGAKDVFGLVANLTLLATLVATGVGFGVALIEFDQPMTAAIIGGVWGMATGYVLNNRLANKVVAFLKPPWLHRIAANIVGPVWGIIVGAFLSYWFTYEILSNNAKATNPLAMGLVVAPSLVFMIMAILLAEIFILNNTIGALLEKYIK